jgi:glycine C-acetyltransferase
MTDLEEKLKITQKSRSRIIVTDGVFSMDGTIAQLDKISSLAKKYNALIMIDECHSTGFMGNRGRGVHELKNVMGKIDIITGTLGKALGGASGGFTSGRKEVIEILRQRSRPYLFSNTLAPSIVGASLKVFDLLERDTSLIEKLHENTSYFRKNIKNLGFDIVDGTHPIVPIMLYDAVIAKEMSEKLLEKGIYVVGFYFPVVPKDKARIRVQLSAGHSIKELDRAINAFKEVGKELKIIS